MKTTKPSSNPLLASGSMPRKLQYVKLLVAFCAGLLLGKSATVGDELGLELPQQKAPPSVVQLEGNVESSEPFGSTSNKASTKQWSNWPAIAYQEVGHPLVYKGHNFFANATDYFFTGDENKNGGVVVFAELMKEFIEMYKNRPGAVNTCGIRINHAMALFLAVKALQPTLVVESGVNAGFSTYVIRQASGTTRIFAIDPEDKPVCEDRERWIDDNALTTYYTGKENFVDILDLDWKRLVETKQVDPDKTLVFLDDHRHAFKRIASMMMQFGARHVIIEDNYKAGKGASQEDKESTPKQSFSGKLMDMEGKWLFQNLISYSEFPPLIPSTVLRQHIKRNRKNYGGFIEHDQDNQDSVPPMLRPDLSANDKHTFESIANNLGLNPSIKELREYEEFMNYNHICYLEIMPTPDAVMSFYQKKQN
ncbi:MAG: hypothetical protein SGILL_008435 [Bacillariaceae sp.]